MNISALKSLYSEKVTVLNRIRGNDIGQRDDIWVKCIVDGVAWKTDMSVNLSSSRWSSQLLDTANAHGATVNTKVLFSDVSLYKNYEEFINYYGEGGFFSLSVGDYIIRDVVLDEVNSKTVTDVITSYKNRVCKVSAIDFPKQQRFNQVKILALGAV